MAEYPLNSVILNVDDNDPTRRAKRQGLRAAGFTVFLPVRTSCAENIGTVVPAGNPHVSGKADPGKTRDLNDVKVLVVDDDVDARRSADGTPYPPFHDVMVAVDGDAAAAVDAGDGT